MNISGIVFRLSVVLFDLFFFAENKNKTKENQENMTYVKTP
jgi:hypothetical protein